MKASKAFNKTNQLKKPYSYVKTPAAVHKIQKDFEKKATAITNCGKRNFLQHPASCCLKPTKYGMRMSFYMMGLKIEHWGPNRGCFEAEWKFVGEEITKLLRSYFPGCVPVVQTWDYHKPMISYETYVMYPQG